MIGWCPEEHTRNAARAAREMSENGTYARATAQDLIEIMVRYMLNYMEPTDRAVLPVGTYPEYQVTGRAA